MDQQSTESGHTPGSEARAEALLAAIYEDVDQRLNPGNDECWNCGGEGEICDCIDGLCEDAESGCADCARPCAECRINAGLRAKAVREEVIKFGDLDVAVAWLKSIGRWRDDITLDQVRQEMDEARAALSKAEGR
jgi:hypothetical protein